MLRKLLGTSSFVAACLLLGGLCGLTTTGCQSDPGPTLGQPEPWSPDDPQPGQGSFALNTVRQHTFATRTHYAHPTVSADGKHLAYAATINGEHADIFVQAVDGRAAQEIAPHPLDDITPSFSPDGKRVAFASNRDGRWNIFIAGMDASEPVVQVTDDGWENFAPCFSPDGMKIAYSTRKMASDPWLIAVADLKSGTRTLLCEGVYPNYSPEGDRIVFSRNSRHEPGWPSIWVCTQDGERQTEVYRSDEHGAITPCFVGSEWIAFGTIGRYDGNARDGKVRADDIWVVHVTGVNASRATWHGGHDWDPAFDSIRKRCYYISAVDGVQNLWSAALRLPESAPDTEALFGTAGGD